MHKSVYDVLYKKYHLQRKLPQEQEQLAQAIVASGKMRLDADTEANFVRLLIPQERIDMTFTAREIAAGQLASRLGPERGAQYLAKVKEDLKKRHPVKPKTELMMARALVLCNELPVIRLIHLEGAEIFISFGNSVGEVMDVARWEQMGANSGLQAVGAGENAVYVSCGGHPFLTEKEYRHSGDGPPAMARFMIIAAQETGHNGDMIRNASGQWVGRHSAIAWTRAPSEKSGAGRISDIATTERVWDGCLKYGVRRIAEWERHLEFYRKVKVKNWRHVMAWCACKLGWQGFKMLMRMKHEQLPKLQRTPYPATLLQTFFPDMLANLTPQAEVYKRRNASEEEAIACIEATARVPQQVVKWGHQAVRLTTPALYDFYYNDIVPACSEAGRAMLQRSK